jgi:dipeptidyl-peptidase-4
MKRLPLIFAILFVFTSLHAQQQDKKRLSTIDAVNPAFFPRGLPYLSWQGDADSYTYVDFKTNSLIQGTVKGKETTLLTRDDLNKQIEEGNRQLMRFPTVDWISAEHFRFMYDYKLYEYHMVPGMLTIKNTYPEEAANLEISPEGHIAYTLDGNLFVKTTDKDEPVQLSDDGSSDIVYGEAVHRSEFGIVKGLFWSDNGQRLAFYRMDQSMVTDYPLINYMDRIAVNNPIKYPMAGEASHHVTVGVYDVESGDKKYLETGEPAEKYLTNITWGPNNELVYIAVVNRDQNVMQLNSYSASTGKYVSTLITEKDAEYVEPEHGPVFLPQTTDKFIWQSEKAGNNHLYLYNLLGHQLKPITRGAWDVTEFMGISDDEEWVYYMSTEAGPLERHAYKIQIPGVKKVQLTEEKGTHRCQVNPNGNYLIDRYSSREVSSKTQIAKTKNGKVTAEIHEAKDPLAGQDLGEMEFVELQAEDNTKLYGRLIKPINFDPNQKYPTIIYVYGGPHVQLNTESWLGGSGLFLQYLAQQGYVVFTLDSRGSAGRGVAFEQAVHRKMGTVEVSDQMVGVKWLQSQSYVDQERMGVHGWSYGGFMTISMMLKNPGVFKACVAGGPVIDWKYYEVMYTERYMDTPQDNPEGYAEAALTNHIDKLEGRLLIIHGQQDNVVVPQHSQVFVRECIKAGKLVDYFPYPTHEHNVRGRDRAHLYDKVVDYFKTHL